jgi:AcrR family transcriptional regulator
MSAKKAAAPRVRRTQRERSATMQARLLDATIDSLYELGYSRTTTIEVAARAGVSRGAQLHHFPTKKKLVAVAVRHLLTRRLEEFRSSFAVVPEGADKYSAAVDLLWQGTSSKAFYAWLELVVAARTDPSLRKTVSEIAGEFSDAVQQTFLQFFFPQRERSPYDIAPVFTLAVMQGLALDRIVLDENDRRIELSLQILKALASATLKTR